ncbi:Hsp70 family protein [Rhodococcus indonesiensis]
MKGRKPEAGRFETVLAIDFGTSNTAAALCDADGTFHELRLGTNGNSMPSGVIMREGEVLVGEHAVNAGMVDPGSFEPSPKRRLPDVRVMIGSRTMYATELVASVYREVCRRAHRYSGTDPDRVILTHPDRWGPELRGQLSEAAARAGIPEGRLTLLSEAQAAAWFYAGRSSTIEPGQRLAVFDYGAGTCDVAVLERSSSGDFVVVSSAGMDGLGGRDLDGRIWEWVREELSTSAPSVVNEVESAEGMRARLALGDRIRQAKESLSELATASIVVSGRSEERVLTLTRDQFERMVAPDVARAVSLARTVFDHAGRPFPETIYLTGGSSLVPLVHAELSRIAQVAELGDPKMVVALGALAYATSSRRGTPDEGVLSTSRPSSRRARLVMVSSAVFALAAAVAVGAWATTRVGEVGPGGDPASLASASSTEPLSPTATAPPSTTTSALSSPARTTSRPGSARATTAERSSRVPCTGTAVNCALAQRLPLTLQQNGTYTCEDQNLALTGLVAGANCTSRAGLPAVILLRFDTLALTREAFDEYYKTALESHPDSGSWPKPTSVNTWTTSTGETGGSILSGHDNRSAHYYLTATVEADSVVLDVSSKRMSTTELLEWWVPNSELAGE